MTNPEPTPTTADTCDHVGAERVTRTAHGYLGDAPRGTAQILCGDCGATLPDEPTTCRHCDEPATGLRSSKGLCDRHSFPEDRPLTETTTYGTPTARLDEISKLLEMARYIADGGADDHLDGGFEDSSEVAFSLLYSAAEHYINCLEANSRTPGRTRRESHIMTLLAGLEENLEIPATREAELAAFEAAAGR